MATENALVIRARIAEQTERYDDMVDFMAEYVKNKKEALSVEERNLLSVAYKNKIGAKRTSWRILSLPSSDIADSPFLDDYKQVIANEMTEIHKDVTDLIDNYLLENDKENESLVFYNKMKGDYCRYKAEFSKGDDREKAAKDAEGAYKAAKDNAEQLAPTSPIRLGLFLNFSVFYYEIMNSKTKACELAKEAFDDAIASLDSLSEEKYKDSTLIMQLIRDNLTLWTSEKEEQSEEQ